MDAPADIVFVSYWFDEEVADFMQIIFFTLLIIWDNGNETDDGQDITDGMDSGGDDGDGDL